MPAKANPLWSSHYSNTAAAQRHLIAKTTQVIANNLKARALSVKKSDSTQIGDKPNKHGSLKVKKNAAIYSKKFKSSSYCYEHLRGSKTN